MKRLLTFCSVLVLLVSFPFISARTYAAHQPAQVASPTQKVTSFHLCSSSPLDVPPLNALVKGIFNGVTLATEQMKSKFRKAGLRLTNPTLMDDSLPDASGYSTDKEITNARTCLAQRGAIGYIGTLNSGAAQVSEPILNKGSMVMISPANTNTGLTCPRAAVRSAQEPLTFHHHIRYLTYYRTLTTDAIQGAEDAVFMHTKLHINKYYLVDDKQTYGVGLAANFDLEARKLGMTRVGFSHVDPKDVGTSSAAVADSVAAAHPQAVFYGGDSETGLVLPRLMRAKGYMGPFMGGDAIENTAWITANPRGAEDNYASVPGPNVFHSAASFRRAYARRFHVPLQTYEGTAYDAAKIVLLAVLKAHSHHKLNGGVTHDRRAILPYVAATKYYGATGLTTFDRNGDTTNRIVSVYKTNMSAKSWGYLQKGPKAKGALPTSNC